MTFSSTNQIDLPGLLRQYFGYSTFRPQQAEVILHTLEGMDSIVLMPTGGGKSICYQLPSVILPGLTVVISPLIALMKDQVQALVANGIPAAFLNSSLSHQQEQNVLQKIKAGEYNLLYVAPERVMLGDFLDLMTTIEISLFAVDEAHCVSTWGHHFRPDYKKLSIIKSLFPHKPVMALTATADRTVRQDIGEMLQLTDPSLFVSSFDRPNLSLAVLPGQKKWGQLIRIVQKYPQESGIIYCASRKGTEQVAAKLQQVGIVAKPYHAGLDAELRSSTQDDFIQGKTHVVCATIAFGMGIDKADIRYIVHYNMPGNVESLYQEIGRGGRDGLPAETILFYSYRDVQTHLDFIEEVEDAAYRNILEAKLKRMQEYAEAQVCRRKILLSYFSENPGADCGNCDVCSNPPGYFDGSIEAQKAISAIARSGEQLALTTLVDVLKAHYSQAVKENMWHQLKTFGKGREHTNFAWQLYLQQMIQQGLFEIDYKDDSHLKLNELSKEVLNGRPVRLVDFDTIKKRQLEQKEKAKVKVKKAVLPEFTGPLDEVLLESLKQLRREMAHEIGKPPYMIFSDVSLRDMAMKKPQNIADFLTINGVGEYKANRYGERFLNAIKKP